MKFLSSIAQQVKLTFVAYSRECFTAVISGARLVL